MTGSSRGRGGMGAVYLAHHSGLHKQVAIKVLPQHLSATPEVRARFEREAKTVSSLNHPHICTLFDVGREGETDYLVMELVEGETLAGRLAKGPLPAADVFRIGSELADALDRAHRAGVVHRDLKPGNIMLTEGGTIKLLDFGLAKSVAAGIAEGSTTLRTGGAQTTAGMIMGTFSYMSPEQAEGRPVDARTDIFSFGSVLYEMVTGRRAFSGDTEISALTAVLRDEPKPIDELARAPADAREIEHAGTCLDENGVDLLLGHQPLSFRDAGRAFVIADRHDARRHPSQTLNQIGNLLPLREVSDCVRVGESEMVAE